MGQLISAERDGRRLGAQRQRLGGQEPVEILKREVARNGGEIDHSCERWLARAPQISGTTGRAE